MRASEILRTLADKLDAEEAGNREPTVITNRPEQTEVDTSHTTDTAGIEGDAQVNVKTMVPPLQQKLDLMKHLAGITSTGVDNSEEDICPECNACPCCCGEEPHDELSIIKQNAGIKPAVIAIADEDEPYEG